MTMQLSNDPDLALAQEWIEEIEAWIDAHGLKGYDPFDIKQHPWIRAAQPNWFTRKATTALCDLFPNLSRKMLRVEMTENPKAYALVALASLRMYQLTEKTAYLDTVARMLDWLRDHAQSGWSGLCWGYPFNIKAKGLKTDSGTPVLVIGAIAGEAFLRAYELTQDTKHLDAAQSIGAFILNDLPRMEQPDGSTCFAYTPGDRRRVHNANLMAVQHLIRLWGHTADDALLAAAEPALRFTLNHQREDGSWYYGEWDESEPFERGILHLIDHHHTGFVLRSLHAIQQVRPQPGIEDAITRGFRYYKAHLFQGAYFMPINDYGKYPVDIHACAEGILCTSALSHDIATARKIPALTMRWTHFFLRDRETGVPLYRKYPFYTSRLVCPRWGVAWIYWALTEYLYHHYEA